MNGWNELKWSFASQFLRLVNLKLVRNWKIKSFHPNMSIYSLFLSVVDLVKRKKKLLQQPISVFPWVLFRVRPLYFTFFSNDYCEMLVRWMATAAATAVALATVWKHGNNTVKKNFQNKSCCCCCCCCFATFIFQYSIRNENFVTCKLMCVLAAHFG